MLERAADTPALSLPPEAVGRHNCEFRFGALDGQTRPVVGLLLQGPRGPVEAPEFVFHKAPDGITYVYALRSELRDDGTLREWYELDRCL